MSFDSGPGPVDPTVVPGQPDPADPAGFYGQAGAYGAPTGPEFAPPAGPYGQAGPYAGPGGGPYGPYGPGYGGPGGPPRKSRAGLIAGIVGGGAVVLVVLVVAAFVLVSRGSSGGTGGNALDDLPAPKTLGRDPVPAEKTITARPADCGISKATAKALTPGASQDGVGGNCSWSSFDSDPSADLDVEYKTDVPGYPDTSSKVAGAIRTFNEETSDRTAPTGSTFKPMTGLGDDAAYRVGTDIAGHGVEAVVVFRAADLVTEVTYRSFDAKASSKLSKKFQRGAFTAAADVAKGLGVAANPAVAQPGQAAPVTVPSDVCGLVPQGLLKTLSGGDTDPLTHADSDDPLVDKDSIPDATTAGCTMSSYSNGDDRSLEVHVTGPTKPGADAAVKRAYLGAYYETRAEKPTGGGGRYFQALSGLGDEAFGSYLDGQRGRLSIEKNTAEVVVRTRTALVTVAFGNELSNGKLTQQQAIKGAYAVAQKVAARVK